MKTLNTFDLTKYYKVLLITIETKAVIFFTILHYFSVEKLEKLLKNSLTHKYCYLPKTNRWK